VIYPVGWGVGVQLVSFAVVALSWALYFRRHVNRRRHDRAITRDACDDEP
jgi:membrane protein implicated in regulation of membrane protease activity